MILILAIAAIVGPHPVSAQESALSDSISGAIDRAAYAVAKAGISRKVLPDVPATSVPRAASPASPPRLDDPLAASYRFQKARSAALHGNFDLAQTHMREALRADPDQPRFRWWFAGEVLKRLDPGTFIWSLPGTVRTALADPMARRRLVIEVHQAALLFTGVLWSVLVLLYLTAHWRYLAHDLSALIFRDARHRLRSWTPWLLIVAALLLRPGWFAFLALVSIPLVIQARGRSRWSLAGVWLAAAFLVFPYWPVLREAVPALDPESETNLLIHASRLPPSGTLMRSLEERMEQAAEPERQNRLRLALAIQHARAGRYERSTTLLQRALEQDPTNVPALVNLANNTYYLGKLDAAVRDYLNARKLAPECGQIPYNLAQVYFKKLFVPEASEALKDARSLGFDPPRWEDPTGEANGYSPVVYLGPEPADLAASCRWEARRYPPLITVAAWTDYLGCPPLSLFVVLIAGLTLVLVLVRWGSNQVDPRGCDNCGVVICRKCCELRQGVWYCKSCAETADRARSEMVLATLLKNRSRSVGLTRSARIALLARLVPGAGHLIVGEIDKALARAWFLALGCFGILFAWSFDPARSWLTPGIALAAETIHPFWYPLPAGAWEGWLFWPVVGGALLVALVYLTALVDSTALRRRLPEHFLLAAGESEGGARSTRRAT